MSGESAKQVDIQYYAILREQRGLSRETLTTSAKTPWELYEGLRQQHAFSLNQERLKVAINDELKEWDTPLEANDTVVFIPPVAGG